MSAAPNQYAAANVATLAALEEEASRFRQVFIAARQEIGKVIVGQDRVVESALTTMFCGGNLLLEGVPGLGKTELIKALSQVLDLEFRRIQFTPDLMPADIIGTNVMSNDGTGYRMEFRKGPVFTQLLLADEINRATPKTQSALLETMQEKTVTVGGVTHKLTPPFFVMATQNPLEQEGTYPLPEAQLDRFMLKVTVPFPTRADLNEIVGRTILRKPMEVKKIMDGASIIATGEVLLKVVVADPIRDYACRLVLATHPDSEYAPAEVKRFVKCGASPRAAQAMVRAGRIRALSDGRAHLSFDDIAYWSEEILQHRILLNYDGQAENIRTADLVKIVVNHVAKVAPAAAA